MTDEEQDEGPTSGESTGDRDLDRQVAGLEKEEERVEGQIDETRNDWESKKGDQSVPGAVPDPDEEDQDAPSEPEGDAVDEAGGDEEDAPDEESSE
jgi:hypothetical protein